MLLNEKSSSHAVEGNRLAYTALYFMLIIACVYRWATKWGCKSHQVHHGVV